MAGGVSRAVAGCFALAAFAVAVIAGLAGGNPATSILIRALLVMVVCYPAGLVVGLVCQHVVDQQGRKGRAEEAASAAPAASEKSAKSAEGGRDALVV